MFYFKETPSKIVKYELTINKDSLIIIRDYMINDLSIIDKADSNHYLIDLINDLINNNCSQIKLLEKPKDDDITLSIKIDNNINKIKNIKAELENLQLDNKYSLFIKEKLENDLEEMKKNKKALFYANEIYKNITFTKLNSIYKEHLNDPSILFDNKRTK